MWAKTTPSTKRRVEHRGGAAPAVMGKHTPKAAGLSNQVWLGVRGPPIVGLKGCLISTLALPGAPFRFGGTEKVGLEMRVPPATLKQAGGGALAFSSPASGAIKQQQMSAIRDGMQAPRVPPSPLWGGSPQSGGVGVSVVA